MFALFGIKVAMAHNWMARETEQSDNECLYGRLPGSNEIFKVVITKEVKPAKSDSPNSESNH
jgi:hypothetical protein